MTTVLYNNVLGLSLSVHTVQTSNWYLLGAVFKLLHLTNLTVIIFEGTVVEIENIS
jgi:hypothetical protein